MLIKENDEFLLHFFIISFLEYHKDEIITTDHSQIPSVLSQLSLKTIDEVEAVFTYAIELRDKTPYSLRLMARKLEIFKPHSNRLKELFHLYEPENMMAMPILPSEVFFIAYNNIVSCPDLMCKNFKNIFDDDGEIVNSEEKNNFYCNLHGEDYHGMLF